MVTSHLHGHPVYWDDKERIWRYSDNNEIATPDKKRPCPKCGSSPTTNGHDSCMANLPDVKYACCGHGIRGDAYIMLTNNRVIRKHEEPELYNTTLKYLINKRDNKID